MATGVCGAVGCGQLPRPAGAHLFYGEAISSKVGLYGDLSSQHGPSSQGCPGAAGGAPQVPGTFPGHGGVLRLDGEGAEPGCRSAERAKVARPACPAGGGGRVPAHSAAIQRGEALPRHGHHLCCRDRLRSQQGPRSGSSGDRGAGAGPRLHQPPLVRLHGVLLQGTRPESGEAPRAATWEVS